MFRVTEEPAADSSAELPVHAGPPLAPLPVRAVTFLAITVPLLGVTAVPFLLWRRGFYWTDFGLLVAMYFLTGLGITIGFHRLLVHRSFETYTWIKVVWVVLGSMAVQGPMLKWVAMHRRHHQCSDTPDDPHSPQHEGRGSLGVLRGFWHAHVGWFFEADPPNLDHYVKDLSTSRTLRVASALFPSGSFLGWSSRQFWAVSLRIAGWEF
jgi:stearoyl-CoA desaturase (Delta-9 desaturase)